MVFSTRTTVCKRIVVLLLGALLAFAPLRHARADQPSDATRQQVPSASAQADSLKQLKEVYKPYPPATAALKMALAQKLIADAKTASDSTSQYLMLHEAADLALAAGDLQVALQATDELARKFNVDAVKEKLAILKKSRSGQVSAAGAKSAITVALDIGWEGLRNGDIEDAAAASSAALGFIRPAPDPQLVASVQSLATEVRRAQVEADHVKLARQKLDSNPSDAEANLTVGRFLCLRKGDWAAGLPMLVRGSDAVLAAVAARDLSKPETAAEQAAIGEQWRDLALKETGLAATGYRERACYWYDLALPSLSGLRRVATERHRDELQAAVAGNPLSASPLARLTRKLNDIQNWSQKSGKWSAVNGHLRGEGDSEMEFNEALPGRLTIGFNINVVSGMRPRIYFDGANLMFGNEGYDRAFNTIGPVAFPYENNKPHVAKFTFAEGRYRVDIDGKKIDEGPGAVSSSIRLRVRGGDGWSPGTTEVWDFKLE